ncbi:MAG TPA: hypothetical protein PLU10_01560 [Chitinophagaceae bacterium]|nr:hypothetical protein [Chitinophagaceae bacterium]
MMFTLADRDPVKIAEFSKWSLESIYQFLYANNIYAKKLEDRDKTKKNSNFGK